MGVQQLLGRKAPERAAAGGSVWRGSAAEGDSEVELRWGRLQAELRAGAALREQTAPGALS